MTTTNENLPERAVELLRVVREEGVTYPLRAKKRMERETGLEISTTETYRDFGRFEGDAEKGVPALIERVEVDDPDGDPRRSYYQLTEKGERVLEAELVRLRERVLRMERSMEVAHLRRLTPRLA